MLKHISIKNYALIETLELEFDNGFTVLTGETGSGKSILLGALGLILGNRADLNSLRDKDFKCIIEGVFFINKNIFNTFFIDNDLDFEENTIIRREISPLGKTRAFINDTPVNLSVLKELGKKLIDIHSQNQTQELNNSIFQCNVLDVASNSDKYLKNYRSNLLNYEIALKKLEELKKLQQTANTEQDYIKFQLEELNGIDLSVNKEEIEKEYNIISNAEDIINISNNGNEAINNSQFGAINGLQELKQSLIKLEKIDFSYKELLERTESTIIELQDIEFELSSRAENLEIDEEKLKYLDELINEINRLEKKHNVLDIKELIILKNNLIEKNNSFESLDNDIIRVEKEVEKHYSKVLDTGNKLYEVRKKGISKLETKIKNILTNLSMPNAVLKVDLIKLEKPTYYGLEDVDFKIITNKGMKFSSLRKVASGGELSRIMLAIKTVLAEKGLLPTLIFDEIDTGVSGEVANKIGDIMKLMGNNMQLISITHLPQVASKGSNHIKVYKEDVGEKTITSIKKLNTKDRILEIAKMLSGNKPTEAAINNAKELLKNKL